MSPEPSLDRHDWDRLAELFEQAAGLTTSERPAFVEAAAAADPTLLAEVESLLGCAREATSFFERLAGAAVEAAAEARDHRAGAAISAFAGGTLVDSGSEGDTRYFAGRYRVESRLGRGGMGVVYRAFDLRLRRTIALKFLPPQLTTHEQASKRFLIEARAAAALDHPNVCTVHEVGEAADRQLYIAMACYEGETLKQKLATGPLPVERAIDYATQVGRGLAAAHDRGIIHRDVKPGNLMVTRDGLVKLLDFGLARLPDAGDSRPGHTPGTTAYMSPEQARGEPLDHRTDLWSLGVVLYEMLTGVRPFRGDGATAVLYALLHQEIVPAAALRPEVPRAVQSLLDRLLQRNRNGRFGDAHEVLSILERINRAEQPPISRRPIERVSKTRAAPAEPPHSSHGPATTGALVGRREEWGRMRSAWDATGLGRSHFVLISGEAGIGKTRLAEELLWWGEHWRDAELHRLRGELLLSLGDADVEAEASFRQAISVAGAQKARMPQLRAAASFVRLLRTNGRSDEARRELEPIYREFTEGYDTFELKQARELLSEPTT